MRITRRLLGIDYGAVRLGIALSDERQIIASPIDTLQAEKKLEPTIKKLVQFIHNLQRDQQYIIEKIIVGLPLKLNGSNSASTDAAIAFIQLLQKSISIPVIAWDERLTTVQAERSLKENKMTRKQRAQVIDPVSAAIILQSYLNSNSLSL